MSEKTSEVTSKVYDSFDDFWGTTRHKTKKDRANPDWAFDVYGMLVYSHIANAYINDETDPLAILNDKDALESFFEDSLDMAEDGGYMA